VAFISTTCADGSGWDVLGSMTAATRPAAVVVVGTSDAEAVKAFEQHATDFIRWPAAEGRVAESFARARQQALQMAVLRTADELQRLLAEASAGGVDVGALMGGRSGITASAGATAGKRRAAATGTLVPTSPWRGGRGDGSDEAVLDLSQEDGGVAGAHPLRVLVREGRRTRFVAISEIDWFEADGNYIQVHAGMDTFRTRGTISAIENALDPRQFVRIHRRIVVNMDRVKEMSPLPGGDGLLTLGSGTTLRLSRTFRSRVR
jgi:two-component system LytT family response regulator